MRNILPDNQMRAMTIAMAGAVVAAVATMFLPAGVLEVLAGSTGLSEMFEVAKPPLGDPARAIIAFGAGALTLAVLAYVLLRHERPVAADAGELLDEEAPSPLRLLTKIEIPKMPWVKGEDDITELSDLPKLKNGDVHPDAPPRRPLSAHDLPVMDSVEEPDMQPIADIYAEQAYVEIEEAAVAPAPAEPEPVASPVSGADFKPSLADMVAQLEAAVAERKKQLADLEMVAAQLGVGGATEAQAGPLGEQPESGEPYDAVAQAVAFAPMQRPESEAVPTSAAKNEPVDAALAAALATLHRMNDGAR